MSYSVIGMAKVLSDFCFSVNVPIMLSNVQLNRSSVPLPCEWCGVVLVFLMPARLHILLITLDSPCCSAALLVTHSEERSCSGVHGPGSGGRIPFWNSICITGEVVHDN